MKSELTCSKDRRQRVAVAKMHRELLPPSPQTLNESAVLVTAPWAEESLPVGPIVCGRHLVIESTLQKI